MEKNERRSKTFSIAGKPEKAIPQKNPPVFPEDLWV
jgi:hypothetical protein